MCIFLKYRKNEKFYTYFPEFINIIKSCQQRNIQTIAMCCNPDSMLVEHVGGLKNSVILPNPTEDSDWNVMPTTSILCFNYIVMLVITAVKKYKKLTKSEYYQYPNLQL